MKLSAFGLLLLFFVISPCSAQSVRIVDKDRHDFGIEANIIDRVTKAHITSSDQEGRVIDKSVFKTRRLVQISAVEPSSYYILKLDCPFSGTIIEMQSVDRIRTLAANSFALAERDDPTAAFAFWVLATRTVNVDSDYSQMARKLSLEISVSPIVNAFTLDEVNTVLLDNKVVTEPLVDKNQLKPMLFLSEYKIEGQLVANKAFSHLIQEYQAKRISGIEYHEGQLDYTTLQSFSNLTLNDLLFKELPDASITDIPLPKERTQ